jgi:protein-S-isoprenylcysteine O-methyltransferase Ste14
MLARITDGLASLVAALVAAGLTLPCTWFTHRAVQAQVAPIWAYGPAVLLAVVGLVLTVAFLRKAGAGIAPSRDRAR